MSDRLGMAGNAVGYGNVEFGKAAPKRLPFLHPNARPFDQAVAAERQGSNRLMTVARRKAMGGNFSGIPSLARNTVAGPKAPNKVLAGLSGEHYGDTLGRLGRATRRQNKEFSASVHPISGRVLSMRRGGPSTVGHDVGTPSGGHRRSVARMAHLSQNAKNPEVRSRAQANLLGQNKNIMGPAPVYVHSHPHLGHVGASGKHATRAYPSTQDMVVNQMIPASRHVVLSHAPKEPVGRRTKAVTSRMMPGRAEIGHPQMRRMAIQDAATLPGNKATLQRLSGSKDPDMSNMLVANRSAARPMARKAKLGGFKRYDTVVRGLTGSKKKASSTGLYTTESFHKRDGRNRDKHRPGAAAVGVGSVAAGAGLVGGGVPGARPEHGRLAQVQRGTKYEATRHLVSATRGGIFGYREDAHRAFLNRQNADLRGWRPHSIGNEFERGTAQGKTGPEKKIIRTMRRARTGSNVALIGGTALVASGLHERRKSGMRKRDDFKQDALIAGGTTTAAAGYGGSKVLEHQGRKWANETGRSIQHAKEINPRLGGYRWETKRKRKLLAPKKANVPDAQAHRSTGDINYNQGHIHEGQTPAMARAAGQHRGAATQERYFARVYGSQARVARKVALVGGAVALTGLAGKHYEIKRRAPVRKGILGTQNWSDQDWKAHQERVNRKYAEPKAPRTPVVTPARPSKASQENAARKVELERVNTLTGENIEYNRQAQKRNPDIRRRMHIPHHGAEPVYTHHSISGEREKRRAQQAAAHTNRENRHRESLEAVRREGLNSIPQRRPMSTGGKVALIATGATLGAGGYALHRRKVKKVDTTMTDAEAHRLAQRYDTRGPLPKTLSRPEKMKAYEARYVAAGGRKAEKWKRRSDMAETGRNIGLAGATGGALLTLAARHKKLGPKLARVKIHPHGADNATIGAAAFGGAAELYGEHARSRRASYQNSPAGVAGSALSRMQAYTPEKKP